MEQLTESHVCAACKTNAAVTFTIERIKQTYFGKVYTRRCPDGHMVFEHRNPQ